MTTSIEVRETTVEAIADLERLVPEFDEAMAADRIGSELAGRPHLILEACLDGAVAGYKVGYEDGPHSFYSWIGAVLPPYRRRGVAQALLDHQERWCKDKGYERIRVKTYNRYRAMLLLLIRKGYDIHAVEKGVKILLVKSLV